MSLPTTIIKYQPPPEAPLPSGGGGGGGGTGGGGLPPPPTENAETYFLRGDEAWAPVLYENIAGLPLSFHPSLHASTHAASGSDPVSGLLPPLVNDPTQVLLSTGVWAQLDYSSLSGEPPPGTLVPHGPTHVSTDRIPLASATHPGFVPALPADGSSASYLGADLSWYPFPASNLPAPPGDASQVLLGTGAYGKLAYSALTGTPTYLPPGPHAPTHQAGGVDPLALDTLAPPSDSTALNTTTLAHGLCPKLSNVVTTYLNGIGKWTSGMVLQLGPDNAVTVVEDGNAAPVLTGMKTPVSASGDYFTVQVRCLANQTGGDGAGAVFFGPTASTPNQVALLAGTNASGFKQFQFLPTGSLALPNDPVNSGDAATKNYVDIRLPTGSVIDFAGSTAPMGWVLCDGTSYATTGIYAALFSVIGYSFGGSGANFNVPDLRSRVTVGAGSGGGLTTRVLAATGGEETHALSIAELATHTHGLSTHTHSMQGHTHGMDHYHTLANHTHLGVNHLHDLQNHQHYCGGVDHLHGDDHYHSISPIVNTSGTTWPGGGGWGPVTQNTNYKSQQGFGATTGASDRSLAFWSNAPNINNTGVCDRDLTTAGPNPNNSDWASTTSSGFANTGGPSTNTTAGPSIDSTTSIGSGTGHNTMPPFAVLNKIIKT